MTLAFETALQGAPFKLRLGGVFVNVSCRAGGRLNVPTLNFAKGAKFRMGHPAEKQVSRLRRIIRIRGRSRCARNDNGTWMSVLEPRHPTKDARSLHFAS